MPAKKRVTNEQRELVRAFIGAQRQVRKLDREDTETLPLAEFHALIALEQSDVLSPGDIAKFLNVNLSKTSRLIQKLEADKLIKITTSAHDARQKEITLTKKGVDSLKQFDGIVDKRTSAWFGRLSNGQQEVFKEFLASLARALAAPEETKKRNEVEIRTYQRRIARAGGLISGPVLAGELNLIEYQILNALIERSEAAMETLFELPFDRAQISRTSDLLQRIGLLAKSRDPKDSRRILARLTAKGRKDFLEAEEKAARIVADATSRFMPRKKAALLQALKLIAQ